MESVSPPCIVVDLNAKNAVPGALSIRGIKDMRKFLFALVLLIFITAPAYSDELDFATMSCGKFLQLIEKLGDNDDDMNAAVGVLSWLYGYVSGYSDVTLYSGQKFGSFATNLGEQCAANKSMNVIEMVKQIGVN